ncbi:MAG: VIT and VWA domain-containing protein [Luteolibacter sp.]
MKTFFRITYLAIIYSALTWLAPAAENQSSAPYFQIVGAGENSSDEQLPLKSAEAKVVIDGTIAHVKLIQKYANVGRAPIEAIYVFPASTRAAVHGMTLKTGDRLIAARVKESVKAKAEYQTAKAEKKTAALLEEHRPNVFQMSVANLLPGDDIDVEIEWSETIPAVESTYEFVFPTVVGPRYTGGSAAGNGETWTANPHLRPGNPNPATFSLDASLSTTMALAEVTCPSHPVTIDFKAKDRAYVKINTKAGEEAANRDFILRWKLGNDQVDAGLLLHRGEATNHFLLQIAPPPRVRVDQIPPRDYVVVLDVSGSMEGFPLNTAKNLLRDLVKGLRTDDTFNVVTFASGSGVLSETPLPANPENVMLANQFIDGQHAGGGTELESALKVSLALPGGENRSRSILLITDGFISADREVRNLIRSQIGNANLFAFGIGSSVNRELMESVARAGGGEPVIVTSGSEVAPAAKRFREMVSNPVLAKVRIEAEGVTLGSIEPDPHPDVFASRPLIVTGTWTGEPKGRIIVRGIGGNGSPFEKTIDLAESAAAKGLNHPALPVLWARERVRRLGERESRDAETIREITSLGLSYSLLTPYTSFLAVDETPKVFEGLAKTVKQALPLPQGVSASAIEASGGSVIVKNGSVPEPTSIGLISFLIVLLALQRRR